MVTHPRRFKEEKKSKTVPAEETVTSIKGFDGNLRCRDFQFEIGKTYECDGEIIACQNGFHGIEGHPLEVFGYYPPGTSRYARVTQSGELALPGHADRDSDARACAVSERSKARKQVDSDSRRRAERMTLTPYKDGKMSELGNAIRNNADLHRTIYRVIGDLATHHLSDKVPGYSHLAALCAASAKILPHLPPPPNDVTTL